MWQSCTCVIFLNQMNKAALCAREGTGLRFSHEESVLTRRTGSELGVRRIPRSFLSFFAPSWSPAIGRAPPQSPSQLQRRKKIIIKKKQPVRENTSVFHVSHPGQESRSSAAHPLPPPHIINKKVSVNTHGRLINQVCKPRKPGGWPPESGRNGGGKGRDQAEQRLSDYTSNWCWRCAQR